jgi:hypothetical protein
MKEIDLKKILSLDGYDTDTRKERRKDWHSEEFFTPEVLVTKMCNKVPDEKWSDPDATFLEPCMGNGQFVVAIIYRKILKDSTWKQALSTTYGVELFQDNVDETKDRVIYLLQELEVPDFDEKVARQIMQENLVCSDFFKWDFENWKPLPSNESIELF